MRFVIKRKYWEKADALPVGRARAIRPSWTPVFELGLLGVPLWAHVMKTWKQLFSFQMCRGGADPVARGGLPRTGRGNNCYQMSPLCCHPRVCVRWGAWTDPERAVQVVCGSGGDCSRAYSWFFFFASRKKLKSLSRSRVRCRNPSRPLGCAGGGGGAGSVTGRDGRAGQGFARVVGKRARARRWAPFDALHYPVEDSPRPSGKRRVYRADSSELFLHQLPCQSLDSVMKCASYPSLHLCQTDRVFIVCYDWENFSSVRKISKLASGVKGSRAEWMLLNKDASVQMKMYMEKTSQADRALSLIFIWEPAGDEKYRNSSFARRLYT